MKCSQIHEGLPQKEIRNFLGMAMVMAFEAECENKKKVVQHIQGGDTLEWVKEDAREQIKYLEKYIQNVNNKQAIITLIKNSGWEEYDVSDDVQNDTGYRLGMSFIGTEEEYRVFINSIYEKKE